jgi:hypothetical protein
MKYKILKYTKDKIEKGDQFQNPSNKKWYTALKSEIGHPIKAHWIVRRKIKLTNP